MTLYVILVAFCTALLNQIDGNAQFPRSDRLNPIYQIRPESTLVTLQRFPLAASSHSAPTLSGHSTQACSYCVEYRYCNGRGSPRPFHLCQLSSGFTGVCCDSAGGQKANLTGTKRSYHGAYGSSSASYPTKTKTTTTTTTTTYITIDLDEVRKVIDGWKYIEADLAANAIVLHPDTKEFSHARFFGGSDLSLNEANGAGRALVGFTSYSKHHQLTIADIRESAFDLRNTPFANTCAPEPTCDPASPYRNADGTCNNLRRAGQGRAVGVFGRLLPAEYADGIAEPKRATDGGELPSARLVSLTISPDGDLPSDKYTLLLMQFGQFVDHDLTRTAVARTSTGASISCCDSKVLTAATRFQHPSCFSISVPEQDTFLKAEQQTCIDFVRSAPAVNPKCRFGPREQLNQLSAVIDGNNIYGTSQADEQKLRAFTGGRLKTSTINGEDFLPTNANDTGCQLPKNSEKKCFMAGDGRVNEVLDLSVIHNVFLREHNRIAGDLLRLNPQWNDELTYQETKRIVVAEMQHIIYNEFLPLLLGPKAYNHFELNLADSFVDTYNPNVDPTILNEFATAAYRLHSLVAGTLNLRNSRNRLVGRVALRDQFNNPGILYERGGFEMRIDGLTGQTIQKFDNFFSRELTNHLFQIPGKRFGLDLVALNIQRGRDHGLPGYVKYRDLCGLSPVQSFADLKRIFSNYQVPDVMSQLYRSVEDIDLFIGGTSEKAMPGAVVGPTFACIIGEQFKRIKEGDRFWYENVGQTGSFTPRQLAEIKRSSMARVLCDNSAIGEMQPNAFLVAGQYNPKLNCESYDIPRVSLKPWANYR